MKATQITIKSLAILAFCTAQAQVDPMSGMSFEQMMMQQEQWQMQMYQYGQTMDQWMAQQMQQAQMQVDQAYADLEKFYIDYYRQHTNDYTTPDQQAVVLGDQLYCQHYPARCQEIIQQNQVMTQISAQGHQQRMNDIQSWGNTQNQIGQTYSDILDMSHQGYMDRSATQSQGQSSYIQGAIYGEASYYNPTGSTYSLPLYPDQNMSYTTPEGYPLYFDYQTNTWYQGDGYGWWTPLTQR